MGIKDTVKRLLPDDTIVQMKNLLEKKHQKRMLEKAAGLPAYEKGQYPFGINLIGDIMAETGLGQSMRILAEILERAGIPFCILQTDVPGGLEHSDRSWEHRISSHPVYHVNLLHVNPNVWAEMYNAMPEEWLAGRYQIAYWLWELEVFPKEWVPCIDTVDEIWAPSEFICQSLRAVTGKPVSCIPYILPEMSGTAWDRSHFGLPEDQFLYLVMYDFKSISRRKNPQGAIHAYRKAFPQERKDTGLVIKVNHLKGGQELQQLKDQLGDYENVYFLTDNMSREEVESLMAGVDVLVSLHRSEGFGLPMAESMSMGTPIVCTNWSATTEFMDRDCACLVDYSWEILEKRVGPYAKESRWADADVDQAAAYMRQLREDPEFYQRMSAMGQQKIREYLSPERVTGILTERMDRI